MMPSLYCLLMTIHKPILIGDLMRQMGVFRSDSTVDHDLVVAMFYYESLMNSKKQ